MSSTPTPIPRLFRFGPYEFESRSGDLRNGRTRLKIGNQSAQILLLLLEQPGELVLREDIQNRLWSENTVVEFDAGINRAVRQLRAALNDSAENPRYIETVSRRGYRFVADVQTGVAMNTDVDPATRMDVLPVPDTRVIRPLSKYAFIAFALLLLVTGGMWWRQTKLLPAPLAGTAVPARADSPPVPTPVTEETRPALAESLLPQTAPLTDQDVLVLADFINTTGDAAFDGALRQALAFELEQSPFLKVMDESAVGETLQLMGRSSGQQITNEIAQEICVRDGQKATIGGSILRLGTTYQVALQAINCQSARTIAREQSEAEDKGHVLRALAKAAAGMRAKLGESLSSLQKNDRTRTRGAVTTTSLEALKAFQQGQDLSDSVRSDGAIPFFQRAIELDSNFAMAYTMLGGVYGGIGQVARRNEALTKAFSLIDRVSERERIFISGEYYRLVTRERNKAIDALQMLVRAYPRFARGRHSLGLAYIDGGEYALALEQHLENSRTEPRNAVFQSALMGDYISLDRFDEAKGVAARAVALQADTPTFHQRLLYIANLQNDEGAQRIEIQWLAGKQGEAGSLQLQASNAVIHGKRHRAMDLYQRAGERATRDRNSSPNAQPPSPEVLAAQLGDCEGAGKWRSTAILCMDAAQLQGAEQETQKSATNPDAAVLLLLRGLRALNAGKGSEAAAEFHKIIDHRGRNWGPLYAPAYLFLARAERMIGDTTKARGAYSNFLALWKDADPDLPFFTQATEELAALR